MKGSEPTIGNDGRAGGNLTSLELAFSRRYSNQVMTNITPNINTCSLVADSVMRVQIDSILVRCFYETADAKLKQNLQTWNSSAYICSKLQLY